MMLVFVSMGSTPGLINELLQNFTCLVYLLTRKREMVKWNDMNQILITQGAIPAGICCSHVFFRAAETINQALTLGKSLHV